jgi:hypothetical protein
MVSASGCTQRLFHTHIQWPLWFQKLQVLGFKRFWGFINQVISKTVMDAPAMASVADLVGMAAAAQGLQRPFEEEPFEVEEEDAMMNSFYALLDAMSTLDDPAVGDSESDIEPEECRRLPVITDDDFEEQESLLLDLTAIIVECDREDSEDIFDEDEATDILVEIGNDRIQCLKQGTRSVWPLDFPQRFAEALQKRTRCEICKQVGHRSGRCGLARRQEGR